MAATFEEVEHIGDGNMPQWAKDDPREYWKAGDKHERANGRLFVEVQVALPVELDREQRRELAKTFARRLTDGEQLPYTVAIHRGLSRKPDTPDNPHVHIVLSERSNDGQARSAETWFRRANRKNPERGGARKVSHLQAREWPESIRQGWAAECNRALQRAGRPERIDPRTLAEQSREALKRGDLEQAEALNRAPEPKRGAGDAIQRRYERGEAPEPSRAVAAWERTRAANARWRQECQQQNQKAGRVRAALDVAERMIPASQEERAIGRAVGEALVRRMAQAGRSVAGAARAVLELAAAGADSVGAVSAALAQRPRGGRPRAGPDNQRTERGGGPGIPSRCYSASISESRIYGTPPAKAVTGRSRLKARHSGRKMHFMSDPASCPPTSAMSTKSWPKSAAGRS